MIARVKAAEILPHEPARWPWATSAVNLIGTFVLGYVATRLRTPTSPRRLFLGTGFCGALTTFSTMQVELLVMLDHRDYALAATYASVSLAAGLLAVALASGLARR